MTSIFHRITLAGEMPDAEIKTQPPCGLAAFASIFDLKYVLTTVVKLPYIFLAVLVLFLQ